MRGVFERFEISFESTEVNFETQSLTLGPVHASDFSLRFSSGVRSFITTGLANKNNFLYNE